MFCYASLLLELGYFDEINLNFLVVGHTHCNLDQLFSVVANKIFHSAFIASPLAMWSLYSVAQKETYRRPKPEHVIHLKIVHDYVKFFAPYVNTYLKYYGVPLRFCLRKICSRAVCQYVLVTPPRGFDYNWLPPIPASLRMSNLSEATLERHHIVNDIHLSELCIIEGRDRLLRENGLSGDMIVANPEQIRARANIDSGYNRLLALEVNPNIYSNSKSNKYLYFTKTIEGSNYCRACSKIRGPTCRRDYC